MCLVILGLVIYLSIRHVHFERVLNPGLVEIFVTFMAPVAVVSVAAVIYTVESPSALDPPLGWAGTGKLWLVGGVDVGRRWLKCCSGRVKLIGGSHFFDGGGKLSDSFGHGLSVSCDWQTGGFIDGHLGYMILFVAFRDARFLIFIDARSSRTVERFLGEVFRNWADRDWDRRTLWIYGADAVRAKSGKVVVQKMRRGWRLGRVGGVSEGGRRCREIAGTCWEEIISSKLVSLLVNK